MAKRLNCNDDKTWLKCVRNVKPSEVLDNYDVILTNPVIGTEFLPELAHKAFNAVNFNKGMNQTQRIGVGWYATGQKKLNKYWLKTMIDDAGV